MYLLNSYGLQGKLVVVGYSIYGYDQFEQYYEVGVDVIFVCLNSFVVLLEMRDNENVMY